MTKVKTIAGLIEELRTFDDQELEVRSSTDDGVPAHPISLVGRQYGACVLMRCLEPPGAAGGVCGAESLVMTTSGDKPSTDAILRADIGYDSTVFDLDQLQTAVEDKLTELPVDVFRLHIENEASSGAGPRHDGTAAPPGHSPGALRDS
jgi:hypothetical protein